MRVRHLATARWAARGALGLAVLAATGCFYVDPINQRPEITSVTRLCPSAPGDAVAAPLPCDVDFQDVHRGDTVMMQAMAHDPDGKDSELRYHWQVFACGADSACDPGAAFDSTDAVPVAMVPKLLASTGAPVQLVHIDLDLFDNRGARESALRSVVLDDGPTLGLRAEPPSATVGGAVGLFATFGDPDGAPSDVQLDWSVTSPDGLPAYTLVDRTVTDTTGDPDHLTLAKTLMPFEVGSWTVTVTATDGRGKQALQAQPIMVIGDRPPCIAQWQPIAAVAPAALPISAPTLFQIPLVDDDLDPYPGTADGTTAFAWSILPPGATAWQPLVGATGNSFALDPATFALGDVVGLRVEIADRTHAPVTCSADQPTCPASPAACIQRQTWRVETR